MPEFIEQLGLRFDFQAGDTVSQVQQIFAAFDKLAKGAPDLDQAMREKMRVTEQVVKEGLKRIADEYGAAFKDTKTGDLLVAAYEKAFATIKANAVRSSQEIAAIINNEIAAAGLRPTGNVTGAQYRNAAGQFVSGKEVEAQRRAAESVQALAQLYQEDVTNTKNFLAAKKITQAEELAQTKKLGQIIDNSFKVRAEAAKKAEALAQQEAADLEKMAASIRAIVAKRITADQQSLEKQYFFDRKREALEVERLAALEAAAKRDMFAAASHRQGAINSNLGAIAFASADRSMPLGTGMAMRQFYVDQQRGIMAGNLGINQNDPRFAAILGAGQNAGILPPELHNKANLDAYNASLERHNNILGRTAVALGVFYGLQRSVIGTIQLYQQLEIQSARTASAMGIPGQGLSPNMRATGFDLNRIAFQTGQPLPKVYEGFEAVIQAGNLPTRAALELTGLGSQLATTTGDNPTTIVNILSGARNAFKLNTKELQEFASLLKRTRDEGVISLDELQNGLGKVFQNARLAGFEGSEGMRQLLAMVTGVTKEAGSAANNMTLLSRVLSDISKPKIIAKLAKEGIEFNRDDPFATIQAIAERGPAFIQGSGIFGLEQTRRGLSLIANEMPGILSRIADTAGDQGYLDRSFATLMETATSKSSRLQANAQSLQALVGRDLVSSLDRALGPMLKLVTAADELGEKSPALQMFAGGLRSVAEAALLIGAVGLGANVGQTLLGISLPGFMGKGFSLPRNLANIGANAQSIFLSATGQQAALKALAERQLAYSATVALGGRAGFGLAGGIGLGIGVAGVGLAAEGLYNTYLDTQSRIAAEKQRDAEDQYERLQNINDAGSSIRRGLGASIGTGTEGIAGKNAVSELKRLIELYPDLASKYRVVVDSGSGVVTINGKVARSFSEINNALTELTKTMSTGELSKWMQEAGPAIANAYDIKIQQAKAKVYGPGNLFNNIFGGVVSLYGMGQEYLSGLGIGNDPNAQKTFDFVSELTGHAEVLRLEEEKKKALEALEASKKKEIERQERINNNVAEIADLTDDEKKEYDKLVANIANQQVETLAQQETIAKVTGQTKEQSEVKTQQLQQEQLYKAYLELLALDSRTSADIMGMVAKDSPQLYQSMLNAVQAMADLAESAHRLAEVNESFADQQQDLQNSMADYANAKAFKQQYNTEYMQQIGGAFGVLSSGLAPKAQPIAEQLFRNKALDIQFGQATQNVGVAAQEEIARQLQVQQELLAMNVEIGDLEMKPGRTEEENKKLQTLLRARDQKTKELTQGNAAYSLALGTVADISLKRMQGSTQVQRMLKGTHFNPDDPLDRLAREQLKGLGAGILGANEIASNPITSFDPVLESMIQGIQASNPELSREQIIEMLSRSSGSVGALFDIQAATKSSGIDVVGGLKKPNVEQLNSWVGHALNLANNRFFGADQAKVLEHANDTSVFLSDMATDMGKAAGITPQIASSFEKLQEQLQELIAHTEEVNKQLANQTDNALTQNAQSAQASKNEYDEFMNLSPDTLRNTPPQINTGEPTGPRPIVPQPYSSDGSVAYPLPDKYRTLTSYYNSKRRTGLHGGIDIAAPEGTPIYARAAGKVTGTYTVSPEDGGGYGVVIDDDIIGAYVYHHVKNLLVKVGQQLTAGDQVGEVSKNHLDIKELDQQTYDAWYSSGFKGAPWRRGNALNPLETGSFGKYDPLTNTLLDLPVAISNLADSIDNLSLSVNNSGNVGPPAPEFISPVGGGAGTGTSGQLPVGQRYGWYGYIPKNVQSIKSGKKLVAASKKIKGASRCKGGVCPTPSSGEFDSAGNWVATDPYKGQETTGSGRDRYLVNNQGSAFGDYGDFLNEFDTPAPEPSNRQPKQPKTGRQQYDPFSQSIINAINAFYQSAQSGDINQAIQNAFRVLSQSISQAVGQTIAQSVGGPGGGILGALVGGGLGLLLSRIGGKGTKQQAPILTEVVNFPDAFRSWTLPSSAYYQPMGSINRSIVQHNNNTVNVMAGPAVANTVKKALFDETLSLQLLRRLT